MVCSLYKEKQRPTNCKKICVSHEVTIIFSEFFLDVWKVPRKTGRAAVKFISINLNTNRQNQRNLLTKIGTVFLSQTVNVIYLYFP